MSYQSLKPVFQFKPLLWIAVFLASLIWSGIEPRDRLTWILEVLPAVIAGMVMLVTFERFRLTSLLYFLILAHAVILMIGGHYTYAEVPLFDYLREPMGWQRNNYDKLGHFAQGFVPALVVRELLIRLEVVTRRYWCQLICICCALAVSAFYELLEWWVALVSEEAAEAFLGTQGYVWDTQSDMGWALLGAMLAVFSLSPLQDRQIQKLQNTVNGGGNANPTE